MSHRAERFLHVLACAPVAVLLTASLAPVAHARAAAQAAPATRPVPYVVAIDAGHGGTPDNNHPDQLFDPGSVAQNGLLEKDYSLDTARRVRSLLQHDLVQVVMTRDRDEYLDIGPRMQTAIDAHAGLFVSIHGNSWTDPTANGSVVLYPNEDSHPFADRMSAALDRRLKPFTVADDGTILRDNLWVHAVMPAVTIEPMYLSNPREADLLVRGDVRDAIAAAVRDAIEAQDPAVLTRRHEIQAWNAAHPAERDGAAGHTGSPLTAALGVPHGRLLVLAGLLLAAWLFRHRLRPHALRLGTLAAVALRHLQPVSRIEEALFRRRRRQARRRRLLERSRTRPHRRSVYDELWF
ncbi:MAG TPA: N-acetylmuramoyl-L-alanine amidase [Candidatus Dormibacteraeota bacterium]|nr:N-acetylmuramoyl-L-alanine amidase [Candidatus Dormibacteraeota bacterium]